MASVAGAFKVLIQAQPDQALAGFKQIIDATAKGKKATDSWGKSVVVLNQGWQLFSSVASAAASGAKLVAGAISDAASATRDFLERGGRFSEQFGQFSNVAAGFGDDANRIIDSIKQISVGTTGIGDAMKIATRALAVGLSGPELDKALTFAKKFSESTGEAFESVSLKLIQALKTGRATTLKEFGLIVESGSGVQGALKAIETQLGTFGDAGFNAADKFKELDLAFEETITFIAKAVQDAPELQEILANIAAEASNVAKFFRTAAAPAISEFANNAIRDLKMLFSGVDVSISNLGGKVTDTFALFAAFSNTIVDIGSTVAAIFTNIPKRVAGGVAIGVRIVTDFLKLGVDKVIEFNNAIVKTLEKLAESSPRLAKAFGIDELVRATAVANNELETRVKASIGAVDDFTTALADGFKETDDKRRLFFDGLKVDVVDFAGQAEGFKSQLVNIQSKFNDEAKKAVETTTKSTASVAVELTKEQKKLAKQALQDITEAYKDSLDAQKLIIKDRTEIEKEFYKERFELAKESLLKEQELAATLFKRGEEDKFTEFTRGIEDFFSDLNRFDKKVSSGRFLTLGADLGSVFSDNAKKFAKLAQDSGLDIFDASPENVKKLKRFFDDQKKKEQRLQEDAKKKFKEDQEKERKELKQKYEQEQQSRDAQTKAMLSLVDELKKAANKELKHNLRIVDSSAFVNGFITEVFQAAGVRAKAEQVQVASP